MMNKPGWALSAVIGVVALGGFLLWVGMQESVCEICRRPLHSVTSYRIQLDSDDIVEVCCPRCGLHFQKGRSDITAAEVADFESGNLFPAKEAVYVVGSEVHLCCSSERVREDRTGGQYLLSWDRCLPSVVAFKNRDRAKAFRREKGGHLSTYDELAAQELPGNLTLKP